MTSISSIGSGGGWSAYGGANAMQRRGGPPDGAQMKEDLFAKIDSNGDDSIDADELKAMAEATGASGVDDWFSTSDTDGDGTLSKTEYDAGKPPPPERFEMSTQSLAACSGGKPPPPPEGEGDALMGLDSDQDGAVSAGEFGSSDDELATALFEALDSDGDKQLGSDEMQALRNLMDRLAHYGAVAGSSSESASTTSLSVQA